jgi:predicted RNA-binding protein YlxR (DUF448 family)
MEGRGAYVCPDTRCLEKAIQRKALDRGLKTTAPAEALERLRSDIVL